MTQSRSKAVEELGKFQKKIVSAVRLRDGGARAVDIKDLPPRAFTLGIWRGQRRWFRPTIRFYLTVFQ